MYRSRTIQERYPYFAFATGTGWRVLDCLAEGRTFISEEYDDKEDALAHVKPLNERYWLEWGAELMTRAVIWKALEQSAPPPSPSGLALLWTRLKAALAYSGIATSRWLDSVFHSSK